MNLQHRLCIFLVFLSLTTGFCFCFYSKRHVIHLSPLLNTSLTEDNYNIQLDYSDEDEYTESVRESINQLRRRTFKNDEIKVAPFLRAIGTYFIAPSYNIANCVLKENLFSEMRDILCNLNDTEPTLTINGTGNSTVSERKCIRTNDYYGMSSLDLSVPHRFISIFVTREPLQRFLSGYMNECIDKERYCLGCAPGELLCTIEKLFNELRILSHTYSSDINFRLSHNGKYGKNALINFYPQSWHCELWNRAENTTFIKFAQYASGKQEMINRIVELFKENGVQEEKLQYINETFEKKSQIKAEQLRERRIFEKILKGSPKHMKMFVRMYYYDYLIFGFYKKLISLFAFLEENPLHVFAETSVPEYSSTF